MTPVVLAGALTPLAVSQVLEEPSAHRQDRPAEVGSHELRAHGPHLGARLAPLVGEPHRGAAQIITLRLAAVAPVVAPRPADDVTPSPTEAAVRGASSAAPPTTTPSASPSQTAASSPPALPAVTLPPLPVPLPVPLPTRSIPAGV